MSSSDRGTTSESLICIWGGGRPAALHLPHPQRVVDAPAELAAVEALRWAFARHPGPVVLLSGDAMLPESWLPRLQAGLALDPLADAVTALDPAVPMLNPLPHAADEVSPAALDARIYRSSQCLFFPQRAVSPRLSLWRGPPTGLERAGELADLISSDLRVLSCDHLLVGGGTWVSPAPGALDPLRLKLALAGDHARNDRPGLDGKGAVLHIVHSWGGGTRHWVEDLIAHLDDRRHFILVAQGDSEGRDCGQALVLYCGSLGDAPIQRWDLPESIRATALESPEYRAILAAVIDQWQIKQLVVSSLIGHSLDALRTELPTLVVFHDYYPLWPRLDVAFETDSEPFTAQRLAGEHQAGGRLGDLDPQRWLRLKASYIDALSRPSIRLAAPSESLRRNLERLDSRLADLQVEIVPHGHRALPDHYEYAPPENPPQRWRIAVVGRLSAPKGKQLLLAALDGITRHADLYLIGAGRDGHDFFGRSGVHVVLDYPRDQLPELLAAVQPHLGLLASTVSETFSYALSELWSLGLPVLATRLGAFAERFGELDADALFEPSVEGLLAAVEALTVERLARWHSHARQRQLSSCTEMAERYRRLLAAPQDSHYQPQLASPGYLASIHMASELIATRQRLDAAAASIETQRLELSRRGGWGFELERRLAERTEWARSLETHLDGARERLAALQQDFEERTDWALALDQEVAERKLQIEALQDEIRQLSLVEAQFQQVITSRSWRLTRPMRYVARRARSIRDGLRFRVSRASTQLRRTRHSLRIRGLRGTAARIRQEFRSRSTPTTAIPQTQVSSNFEPFVLPRPEQPQVSVVIPVHNHFDHTHGCLLSLLHSDNTAEFEVVVVDDASSDETPQRLTEISGITHLRNASNLGFIGTCNRGAAAARGQYVVFLNNDTAVADGWLDALLDTFERNPDAGLVGAKLVYPDGRLQEAGGIVFADGSGWNYGRFEDPDHPSYNFLREVDYCSGAAIMIRRELFETLGGFDNRYAPAYYEDTDLAFAVRAHGLKVYYQPASVVTHFEGVTSGTDTATGIKRYQLVNQQKFLDKWRDALARQPQPGTDIRRAREHGRARRALIIDACTPEPDKDSGSVRIVNLMQIFRDLGYQMSFVADNRAWVEGYTDALQRSGVEVWFHPWAQDPGQMLEAIGDSLDVVLVSRHYIACNYVEMIRRHCPKATLLFDTVDLHYLREERLAELEKDTQLAAQAARTRAAELAVARDCDVTLVVSAHEQQVLASAAPKLSVAVLSNIHRVHGRRQDFAQRRDLLFVGGYQHPPNIDAVQWFVREIFPHIRERLPEVVFHIIGSKAPPEVRKLGQMPGVEFHGFVPEIEPWLDGCRLAVAPLRYGAGVKGKVNSSMSYGQPVVASSPAVEGMFVRPGIDVLVADEPAAFASAVIEAYQDEALWNRLSDGGLANVERYFSFDAASRALQDILQQAGSKSA